MRFLSPTTPSQPSTSGARPATPSYDRTSRSATEVPARPAPRAAIPVPSTSQRTTYAQRFERIGDATFRGGRAGSNSDAPRIGGTGEVSLETLRTRYGAATPATPDPTERPLAQRIAAQRDTAGYGPAARYRAANQPGGATSLRSGLGAPSPTIEDLADRQAGSRARGPAANHGIVGPREGLAPGTASLGGIAGSRSSSTAPRGRATWSLEDGRDSLMRRTATDRSASKLVLAASDGLAQANRSLLTAGIRPLLGRSSSIVSTAAFPGYGGYDDPSIFGGKDDCDWDGFWGWGPYGYGKYGYGGYGWWPYGGCGSGWYSPFSAGWYGWTVGWASSWGWYLNFGWDCWSPKPYSWTPAWYWPTVVNHYVYEEPQTVVVYQDPDPLVVNVHTDGPTGEAVWIDAPAGAEVNWVTGGASPLAAQPDGGVQVAGGAPAPSPALTTAALRYLELGDSAFSTGRYGDAVHFYARALEFAPDQGMLYLVLSDALFATGDYHYCAHTIRRAVELEPMLVENPVDKHAFYDDPLEFDRQLAQLELYLADRPTDVDARLVLALNYLFGGRPQAAVELLEGPSVGLRPEGEAVAAILASAREHQYGPAGLTD